MIAALLQVLVRKAHTVLTTALLSHSYNHIHMLLQVGRFNVNANEV